jgi:hypothetical protein
MALYTVTTGNTALAADLNQVVNLLNGTDTGTQLTISNRIRAQFTGATAASGYVGGTTTGAPTTGTFAVGDFVVTQDGVVWICTTAGSPGTWTRSGVVLDTTNSDIKDVVAAAVAGTGAKAAAQDHQHSWATMIATALTWTQLQTFSAGAALGPSPTANQSADTTGNTWTGTANRLAIGYGGQSRQIMNSVTRDDTKAVEGDILVNG